MTDFTSRRYRFRAVLSKADLSMSVGDICFEVSQGKKNGISLGRTTSISNILLFVDSQQDNYFGAFCLDVRTSLFTN